MLTTLLHFYKPYKNQTYHQYDRLACTNFVLQIMMTSPLLGYMAHNYDNKTPNEATFWYGRRACTCINRQKMMRPIPWEHVRRDLPMISCLVYFLKCKR